MNRILKAVCLILALSTLLVGCGQKPVPDEKADYRITVISQGDTPVEGLKVFVYENSTLAELVCVDTTDASGSIAFVEKASGDFVALLKEVPAGYAFEEMYPLKPGQTDIQLSPRPLTPEEMQNARYGLGDRMPDFTVTDCAGENHSLYELLESKKAVVLNFWFINCGPCKMEFPYLQEVFDAYGEDVAFLALNPVDGTDDTVLAYQSQQKLTFPMASCDAHWQDMLMLTAYPTTLILDREGYICLSHTGMFTDSSALMNAMAYFTRDDYQQRFFETIEEIPVAE